MEPAGQARVERRLAAVLAARHHEFILLFGLRHGHNPDRIGSTHVFDSDVSSLKRSGGGDPGDAEPRLAVDVSYLWGPGKSYLSQLTVVVDPGACAPSFAPAVARFCYGRVAKDCKTLQKLTRDLPRKLLITKLL